MVINAECGKTVRIAYQGENNRQQVRFDLADIMGEFPGGTAVLAILRSGDTDPVPAAQTEMDGQALVWTVTAWECAVEGFVYAQVTYAVDQVVAKTRIWRFDVKNSLVVSSAEPEDWQDLVGQLVTAADGVNSAISAAMNTLDEKVAAAEAAQDAAEDAQEAAETARDQAVEAVGQYDAMTAEATGLAAGEEPTAVIDHTGDHPVLRLGIPAGERGADGAQGPQGERGPAGPAGDPGDLIDDTAASTSKTFSSSKLETQRSDLLSAIERKFGIQNVGSGLNVSEDVSTGKVLLNTDVKQSDITNLQQNKADIIITSASGSIASISDGADGLPVESMTVQIEPVQSGSGDPSPDNVRPISGWTGANVYRTGKNLIDPSTREQTSSSVARYHYDDPILLKAGKTYTLSADASSYVYFYDKVTDNTIGNGLGKKTLTPSADVLAYFRLYIPTGVSETDEIQLEPGSTATAYEPYQVETYPITWESAGTVYGGTVNPVTGKLIVTDAEIESYNGETLPSTWISDRDVYAEGTTPTIGAQVVYKLATPVEYDLTPTEIRTLLGYNAIWADTGDVSVDYRADTKLYVERMSASGGITVDTALSSTSTNPVQNKVINTALAAKEPKHNTVSVSGTTPTISGVADTRYICGEVSTLTITAQASGDIEVIFDSGSTATVLTVTPPTGVSSIKWANGFDPTSLDANTRYDLIITDGEWGLAASWA